MSVRITKKEITEAIEAKRDMDKLKKVVDAARKKIEEVNLATGQSDFRGTRADDIVKLSVTDQTAINPSNLKAVLDSLGQSNSFFPCLRVNKKDVNNLDFLTPAHIASMTTKTGEISKITWPRMKK